MIFLDRSCRRGERGCSARARAYGLRCQSPVCETGELSLFMIRRDLGRSAVPGEPNGFRGWSVEAGSASSPATMVRRGREYPHLVDARPVDRELRQVATEDRPGGTGPMLALMGELRTPGPSRRACGHPPAANTGQGCGSLCGFGSRACPATDLC